MRRWGGLKVEGYSGLPPAQMRAGAATTTAFSFAFAGAPTSLTPTSTLPRPFPAGGVKSFLLGAGSDESRGLRL